MPIGNLYKYTSKSKPLRRWMSIFGIADLHSHIRIKPLIDYFSNFKGKSLDIIEIGCGSGINGFELYKINQNISYYGFDLNPKAIATGKLVTKKLMIADKIQLFCEDATTYQFDKQKKFDIIILMDIIEHIEDPAVLLDKIGYMTHNETIIIISVPTYLYKKIFGNNFHSKIGHVKDGYTLNEIAKLFKRINYLVVEYKYNTGLISNIGCFVYYRLSYRNKYLTLLQSTLLSGFKYLDLYNSEKVSCSLFVVLMKGKKTYCPRQQRVQEHLSTASPPG